jgi:hypothetical protein
MIATVSLRLLYLIFRRVLGLAVGPHGVIQGRRVTRASS